MFKSLKLSKKAKIIGVIILILLITFSSILYIIKIDTNDVDNIKENKNNVINKTSAENKEQDEIQTNKADTVINSKNDNVTSSEKKEQDKTTTNNSNSIPKNDISSSQTITEEQIEQPIIETPKQEEPKPSYIGVPDPNHPDYSFHNGVIEESDKNTCLSKGENISFIDTVDIINTWCVPVRDGQNIILGYYLVIKCNSGNCNKYKTN
ncbi:MAG: hypothetical protein Q4G04_00455 [bacterium]|nr:hypothetical protein [bacterium]